MSKSRPQRRTAAEIRKTLSELEKSGLSRARFAADHNLPLSTLQYWLRKHGRSAAGGGSPEVIAIGTLPGTAVLIEIELPGGEILRLDSGFRREDLRAVLAELRRC